MEIAKALSKEVKLLILDEPTAALNDDDSAHLLDLLRGLRGRGHHLDHHLPQAQRDRRIADTTTIIRDGRTIETLDMAADEVTEDRIIPGMVGRDLDHRFPPHEPHIGEEVLRIEDWTVHSPTQPGRVVVDGANLTLRRGEIVGLAGLMGAGPHRAGDERVRPLLRHRHLRPVFKDGKEIQVAHGAARRSSTASPTPPRTASGTGST